MYKEYVFENKENEVAYREIMAILFRVVVSAKGLQDSVQKDAFSGDVSEQEASALQDLYLHQEDYMRELLQNGESLGKTLQKIDSCFRVQKQIEDKSMKQRVSNLQNKQSASKEEVVPVQQDEMVSSTGEVISNEVDEAAMALDEGDALSAPSVPVIPYPEEDVNSSQEVVEEKTENPVEEAPKEEPVIPYIEETVGDSSEEKSDDAEKITTDEKIGSPAESANHEMSFEEQSSPEIVSVSEAPSTGAIDEASVVSESDNNNEPVLMPIVDDTPSLTIVDENKSSVTEDLPAVDMNTNENKSSVMEDLPVVDDASIVEDNDALTQEIVTDGLTFKKRGQDAAKVIMISGIQASKLRGSLATQEALLSGAGFFPKAENAQDMLEPGMTAEQIQIEQLMAKANELYAAGNVDEAQNIYNQISELNKALQEESAGITK